MAQKECNLCGEIWDTHQCSECPTCRRIRNEDLAQARRDRLDQEALQAQPTDSPESRLSLMLKRADSAEGSARSLNIMANLVGVLGVLGGVILLIGGLADQETPNFTAMLTGVGVVLFWLLVRAFGVAVAARLELAAAEARLQSE